MLFHLRLTEFIYPGLEEDLHDLGLGLLFNDGL